MLEAYSHSPIAMVDQIDQPVGSGTKKRPADESERVVGNVIFFIVTYKKCCPNPTNVYYVVPRWLATTPVPVSPL